jgi:hypothetical protein
VSEAPGWVGRLAPFTCQLQPPGGAPLRLSGRIDDGRYRLIAERRGQRHELELSDRIERSADGAFAWVEPRHHPLGPGLWLTLEPAPPPASAAAATRAVALTLRLETRSPALERGAPVFERLGGGPALARLLAPPRWTATLAFGADGEALREPADVS